MSNELPIKATLKAGTGYDAPWLTVDGANPDDLKLKLEGIAQSGALQALVEAAELLKAANNAGPLLANSEPAPQAAPAPAQGGWGQPPAQQQQQQAPAQQPPSGREQNRYGGPAHPEGLACDCGKVLEYKKTGTGKGTWRCPDWRWNNGTPNDHRQEWAS